MTQNNQNNNDTNMNNNFADLLEDSYSENERMEPGQMIEATIVKIIKEWIFINLGGKSEGHIEASELIDGDGNLTVKEGDTIKAYFISSKNDELLFTTKISSTKAGYALLERAYDSEIPVEGLVENEIKGGYHVKIGDLRAFCPYSQMGLMRTENPDQYIGQNLSFKITEFSENGRNIVLSNRSILEEKRKEQVEALKKSLQKGMKVKGTVTSIQKFGAFIDLDGVHALLPISEISRGRVDEIHKELSIGQEIEAAIINLDWENERISLSIKEILPDPWEEAKMKYKEGSRHTGQITRLTNFGAFVNLEPGLNGLIHISDLGAGTRINHPREVVQKGKEIEVKISSLDTEKKRISLKPVVNVQKEENYQKFLDNKNDSYKPMGNLGNLLKDKLNKKDEK